MSLVDRGACGQMQTSQQVWRPVVTPAIQGGQVMGVFPSTLDVYKVVNIEYHSLAPCSHSQWLAYTLSEVFEISVVIQLKGGEKEDFEIS